jgi:hypothetical protein
MDLYDEDVENYIHGLYLTTLSISLVFSFVVTIYYTSLIRVKINQLTADLVAELRFL